MSLFGAMIRSLTEEGKEKAEGVGTFLKKRFRSESGESVFGFGDPMAREDMDRYEDYIARTMTGQILSQAEQEDFNRVLSRQATVAGTTFGMTAPVASGLGTLGTAAPRFAQTGPSTLRRLPGQLSAINRAAAAQGIRFPAAGRGMVHNVMNPRTTEQMLRLMQGI